MLKERTYEEFLQEVQERILTFIPNSENLEVKLTKVKKTNNLVLDGLSIFNPNEKFQLVPTIYLNEYFTHLNQGRNIESILFEIARIYQENIHKDDLSISKLDLQNLDKVFVSVINREKNKNLLNDIPHIVFEDLAIVFRHLITIEDNTGSILITNELIKQNLFPKMNLDALYEKALLNTRKLFHITVKPLEEIILEILKNEYNLSDDELKSFENPIPIPMYCITNNKKFYGANTILFNEVFEDLSNKLNSDLYILPSSIHELIAVPTSSTKYPKLLVAMVSDVNISSVAPEDILSNSIYIYRRDTKKITLF